MIITRILCQYLFGWSHGSGPYKFGWLSNILPYGLLVTLNFLVLFDNQKKKLYRICLLVIISSILIGSRSILFSLFFHFIFFTYFYQSNYIISRTKKYLTIILFLTGAISSWIIINKVRGAGVENGTILVQITQVISRLGAPFDALYLIINSSETQFSLLNSVFWDIKGIIFNSLNSVLPGSIFQSSSISAGAIFKTIIFNESLSFQQGDVWSGFGYLFTGFKNFTFIAIITIFFIYSKIVLIKPKKIYLLLILIYFIYYFATVFISVGMLENFITDSLTFLIQCLLMFLITETVLIFKQGYV